MRSEIMSRIRSKNTGPEKRLAGALARRRIRFSKYADLPGRPDFILKQARAVVFVDGCFWHGCPRHGSRPHNNKKFWYDKLDTNQLRDRSVTERLQKDGWVVLRFWEHEVMKELPGVMAAIGALFDD